jgi:hypothetical protein
LKRLIAAFGITVAHDNTSPRERWGNHNVKPALTVEETMRNSRLVGISSLIFLFILSQSSAGQIPGSIQKGFIHLKAADGTNSPVGIALLGQKKNGILITEAGVPATIPMGSGQVFTEIQGSVNTGIALANPGVQDADISYEFSDSAGQQVRAGKLSLPAHHQMQSFFNEQPFALSSSLVGTFTFTSSSPVSAVGLRSIVNERSEVLNGTLPVSMPGSGFGGTELPILQLENGANWATEIVLINPGNTTLAGTLQFLGREPGTLSGRPAKVIVDNVTGSAFPYVIPAHGVIQMLPRLAHSKLAIASARIIPTQANAIPSCLAIFSYAKNGITVSTASMPALPAAKAFRMYAESSDVFGHEGSIQSLLTVSNSSNDTATSVRLDLLNLDGTSRGSSMSTDMPPRGQMAKLITDMFRQLPSPFKGILRITASSPVSVAGLRARYNERGDLLVAATPPYDDSTAPRTEFDFPYFIHGGGYFTQLILLSTGSSHSGSLWLFSQDGVPLPQSILQPNP